MRKEGSFLKIHIVQKGDTLWEIAKKYDVDFEELKQQNSHLASPDMIMPGMKIRIPTHSKKITTDTKKQGVPVKNIKAESPVKKAVPKVEKSIELPQMPTFPLKEEEVLSTQEKKVKEYPTSILPDLPETPKEQKKPKTTPTQEVKPEVTAPPQHSYQPKEMMMTQASAPPSYHHPQMMPMVTYPCQGFMPMPAPPMGCGCGGTQGFPYGFQGMPPMYPVHQMPQTMQPNPNFGMYPSKMNPLFDNQEFTGYHSQPREPQMYPANITPPEVAQDALQMYPEPPLGMRDEKQELYPTPNEPSINQEEKQLENDNLD